MKQIMRPSLAAVAVIAALGVAGVSQAQTQSTTVNKAQASEIVGYELAGRYPDWARSLIDPQQVGAAVTRALQGQKPSMNETQAESVAKAFGTEFQAKAKQHYDGVRAEQERRRRVPGQEQVAVRRAHHVRRPAVPGDHAGHGSEAEGHRHRAGELH